MEPTPRTTVAIIIMVRIMASPAIATNAGNEMPRADEQDRLSRM
jgi:hypothetical protein